MKAVIDPALALPGKARRGLKKTRAFQQGCVPKKPPIQIAPLVALRRQFVFFGGQLT